MSFLIITLPYQKDIVYQKEKFKSPLALDFLHVPTSCLVGSSLPSYVKAFPEQVSMPGSIP